MQGIYVRTSADPADKHVRSIDLAAAIAAGVISRIDIRPEDNDLFVKLTTIQRDDADAMALAIAESRGWVLATDDRKLKRLAGERGVRIISTPGIMRLVAEQIETGIPELLKRIQDFARSLPSGDDADVNWWKAQLAERK